MLLQKILPHHDVNEVHSVNIHAPPERVYQALSSYRLSRGLLLRMLFGIRSSPFLLTARGRAALRARRAEPPFVEMLQRGSGFVTVAESPNRELVVGLVGKFWQLTPESVKLADGEAFLRFADPAYARAAMNFHLVPNASGTTLSTETRVRVPDPANRRRFRLYWALIGFFSGVIRMEMLWGIKRAAESGREQK